MHLLLVDDDHEIRANLRRALSHAGYRTAEAGDGERAAEMLLECSWDAIILDALLPRLSGLALCLRLRAEGDRTPILMLSARDSVDDRVAGFDAGADDYLGKPFAVEELIARVKGLLRRGGSVDAKLRVGALELDPVRYEVLSAGRRIELTSTEFALLELLMRHPGGVLTHEAIGRQVWQRDLHPRSNLLRVYIGYLRDKLEQGGQPHLIHTVRGVGYMLREQ